VSLASILPKLVDVLGKLKYNECILPLVLSLLRDEMQEVRSAILDNFAPICKALNAISISEALFPVLQEMQRNPSWRVKQYY